MNEIKKISIIKSSPSGEFEGYANVFDVTDNQGDCIRPGTFIKSIDDWLRKGRYPSMYFEHDPLKPIGKWLSMKEDQYGLKVKGKLLLELPLARQIHTNVASFGLSVGMYLLSSEIYKGTRYIYQVDLKEISLTKEPANEKAKIFSK